MALLTFILGLVFGFLGGVYLMYLKCKELSSQYLDKTFINSLLRESLKEAETKKPSKTKK